MKLLNFKIGDEVNALIHVLLEDKVKNLFRI